LYPGGRKPAYPGHLRRNGGSVGESADPGYSRAFKRIGGRGKFKNLRMMRRIPALLATLVIIAAGLSAAGLLGSCQNEQELLKKKYIAEGMVLYRSQCQNCHQIDGTGFEKLIPPLTDTLYLRQNRDRL